MQLERVRTAAEQRGLVLRGGFHPDRDEPVPRLADGGRPQTIVLLGNVDFRMWRAFAASPEAKAAGDLHGELGPMDRWSLRIVTELAAELGAEPAFPFVGPPHFPFQRWAQKSERVWPSPLGMLIHREFGLWHAYRGALCFGEKLSLPPLEAATSPCESCADQPCLSSCPVSAFSDTGYDVPRCAGHIRTPTGRDCLELGCRARRACPVGVPSRYEPAQAAFHMTAFLRARQGEASGEKH